jgi:membrane dipeptidase
VSDLSESGFWDVVEAHTRPFIASHSNCKTLTPHRRNLSDDQIRAVAKAGGVQGITFVREFLGGTEDINRVIEHVAHALDVVGDSLHLGLGSDFDGVENPVRGLEDVTSLPRLADQLSERGFDDSTVANILGRNYIRFLRTYWTEPQIS